MGNHKGCVTRTWAEPLTWRADDYDCDFDPEYLETQYEIADDERERDHIARVMLAQLKREVGYGDEHFAAKERFRLLLRQIASTVDEFVDR